MKNVTGTSLVNPLNIPGFRDNVGQVVRTNPSSLSNSLLVEVSHVIRTIKTRYGEKKLLDDINFVVEPHEFVAILGGSGAGKSTLLHALSGIHPATEGEVRLNGRNLYEEYDDFRLSIGYVPQDDIVHSGLTVEEIFTYSSRLRFPAGTSESTITRRVNEVLEEVELTAQRLLPVKDLSGGQRKRVNIGVELLTRPGLLFLDEATSGLDPDLERSIMELLVELKQKGSTIIMVTHATANISMCDKLVFLTRRGQLAFFGSPSEALEYFGVEDVTEIYRKLDREKSPKGWAEKYKRSTVYQKYQNQVGNRQQQIERTGESTEQLTAKKSTACSSFFTQWKVLTGRYIRLLSRDRKNLVILCLQAFIIPFLLVLAFYHSAPTFRYSEYRPQDLEFTRQIVAAGKVEEIQQNIQEEKNRRSFMSNCIALMVFTSIWLGTSNAAREIVKERAIYRRERLAGMRVGPYLLSKIGVLTVISLVQTLLLVSIVACSLDLPKFWPNVWAFFLLSLAGAMMGLVISAIASNSDKALSTVPIILVPQIILSGALVPIAYVKPECIKIVFYLAVSKWGYELIGGDIININGRSALQQPLPALAGNFSAHWGILVLFIWLLFGMAAMTLVYKDRTM
jgi:ABC-type multidrug transport system ATPase subunit